jgi:hypothetical protein
MNISNAENHIRFGLLNDWIEAERVGISNPAI